MHECELPKAMKRKHSKLRRRDRKFRERKKIINSTEKRREMKENKNFQTPNIGLRKNISLRIQRKE